MGLTRGSRYAFYSLYLADVLLRAFVLRREWLYDSVDGVQHLISNVFNGLFKIFQ